MYDNSRWISLLFSRSVSHVWVFAIPWTAACWASLSFTVSQNLLKLMSIESWCHLTISSSVTTFSSCPQSFPASGSFPMSRLFPSGGKVLEFQLQSFQWIFRTDFLSDELVWSPCSPKDSQEFSPTSQFKNINSSALSLWFNSDYWKKNHSFN